MRELKNPFVTNGYAGEEYFCDRSEETRDIIDLLTNGNNIALISPRRIGKTDLIHHSFAQATIRENYHTFIIDIYSTSSLNEMVNMFGRAIINGLRSKSRSVWEKFLQTLSSIRSEITFDINGLPVWGIGLGALKNPETTLDELFNYLNNADKPCLVAIDEFQQIMAYGDIRVEALLRTYIQRCPNAHFIFSGSQRHLMSEMFTSSSRPFYQSVTLMSLRPLSIDKYKEFASRKFEERGKHLDTDVVDSLFEKFKGVTSYIQRVMNVLFLRTSEGSKCTTDMIEDAIGYVVSMASDSYETLFRMMPVKQRNVLMAIAAEKEARNVNSGSFVKKYNLVSPSSVSSAIKGLLDKDFITYERDALVVQDQLMAIWLTSR